MKHSHAYGILKHHCQMLVMAREANLSHECIIRYIDAMTEEFNELHNEDGTLKEFNEGNNND